MMMLVTGIHEDGTVFDESEVYCVKTFPEVVKIYLNICNFYYEIDDTDTRLLLVEEDPDALYYITTVRSRTTRAYGDTSAERLVMA